MKKDFFLWLALAFCLGAIGAGIGLGVALLLVGRE
jgi:hypothetical protein